MEGGMRSKVIVDFWGGGARWGEGRAVTEDLNRFRLRCPGPGAGAGECDGAQMRTRAHARPLFHTRTGPNQVAIQGLAFKGSGMPVLETSSKFR